MYFTFTFTFICYVMDLIHIYILHKCCVNNVVQLNFNHGFLLF